MKQKTVSLWSYTNSQLSLYQNPLYWATPNYQLVLMPIASMRYIKPWKSLYCRWNPSMRQQVRHQSQLSLPTNRPAFGPGDLTIIISDPFIRPLPFLLQGSRVSTDKGASSLKGTARETARGGSSRTGLPSESISNITSTAQDTFPGSLIERKGFSHLLTFRSYCKWAPCFRLAFEPVNNIR